MHAASFEGGPSMAPFPVCLAIKYGNNVLAGCPDFILDAGELWMFIRTASPPPEGTPLLLHFYIPPENKLLAEAKGRVGAIDTGSAHRPKGMFIQFDHGSREKLEALVHFVEQTKHLVDRAA